MHVLRQIFSPGTRHVNGIVLRDYEHIDIPKDRNIVVTTQIKSETPVNKERFEKGLAVRREVLGSEYVDQSLANADDFNRPLQELVTEYCWGEIWTQPDLPRRTRSLINLAMISALNRPHELQLHVRGALRNGCSKDEIRAVLMQVAIYCGVPAAIDAFRVAATVLKEEGV